MPSGGSPADGGPLSGAPRARRARRRRSPSARRRVEREVERPQAAARDVGSHVGRRIVVGIEAQVREPPDERLHGDLRLQPGERRADAEMRSQPEPQMTRRRTPQQEGVGIGEAVRIPVGGAKRLADEVAGLQLPAAELQWLGDVAAGSSGTARRSGASPRRPPGRATDPRAPGRALPGSGPARSCPARSAGSSSRDRPGTG